MVGIERSGVVAERDRFKGFGLILVPSYRLRSILAPDIKCRIHQQSSVRDQESPVIDRTDPGCGFRVRYRELRRPSLRCPRVPTAESSAMVDLKTKRSFLLTQRDLILPNAFK